VRVLLWTHPWHVTSAVAASDHAGNKTAASFPRPRTRLGADADADAVAELLAEGVPAEAQAALWHTQPWSETRARVHTTVRDDYGPGLVIDAGHVASGSVPVLRLALSAHPRPTAVVLSGWEGCDADASHVEIVTRRGGYAHGAAAVDAEAAQQEEDHVAVHAVPSVRALLEGGGGPAYAVDVAAKRLVVWLDHATMAQGAVLRFRRA
jgi:hypothetical protein